MGSDRHDREIGEVVPGDKDRLLNAHKSMVKLGVSAKESTNQDELKLYISCAAFIAAWLEYQNGARGLNTEQLFDEFRDNVCLIMRGGTDEYGEN